MLYNFTPTLILRSIFSKTFLTHRQLSLYEWQSKELLHKYGCAVQRYIVACCRNEANEKLQKTFAKPGTEYVVKAQVLTGGRDKGHLINSKKGFSGICITKSLNTALEAVEEMIGKRLVTAQTTKEGLLINKVLVAEGIEIKRETYLAILMDCEHNGPLIIASSVGGMDIESIAKKNPGKIFQEPVNIETGLLPEQTLKIAELLQFTGRGAQIAATQIKRLYDLFINVDATQIEINPFVETIDGSVYCVDAKLDIDENAAFRHEDIFKLENFADIDPCEVKAKQWKLHYIPLRGNIACIVNGAGLAMATMDLIKLAGGEPANFLDIGGSVTGEGISAAFDIITGNPKVEAILVNIFGGIVNCVTVANGLINAFKQNQLRIPLVVRLEGTNAKTAVEMLERSNVPITTANDLEEAVQKIMECLKNPEGLK